MKTLKDLENDIDKCSKCGLCQNVCPIYKATGNECTLSRGKFTLLNGVIKKHIKLDSDILKYVDLCLNCNACKKFCPSNIDAREIFTAIKSENHKKQNILSSFLNSYRFQEFVLSIFGILIRIYKFLKLHKLTAKCQPIAIKLGKPGRAFFDFQLLNRTRHKTQFKNFK